jgi:hypothetical protein
MPWSRTNNRCTKLLFRLGLFCVLYRLFAGKSGYAPAGANEWVKGVCEKPRIKCAECPHRRFLPVTDEVIRCHLSGQDGNGWDFTIGVYPMLLDETCFFVVSFSQWTQVEIW